MPWSSLSREEAKTRCDERAGYMPASDSSSARTSDELLVFREEHESGHSQYPHITCRHRMQQSRHGPRGANPQGPNEFQAAVAASSIHTIHCQPAGDGRNGPSMVGHPLFRRSPQHARTASRRQHRGPTSPYDIPGGCQVLSMVFVELNYCANIRTYYHS